MSFFFNVTATTEIYTLSLHDALPIFNVGFVGSRVLPIAEIDFSRMPEGAWPILTYAGKWELGSADDLGSAPVCPAGIPQKLADRLIRIAELAWRTMRSEERRVGKECRAGCAP